MYTQAFDEAINHAMLYEVGGFWKLTPEVIAGLIGTPAQKKACGYTNDPRDRGGETKFGIAKTANPTVDIAKLTWDGAKAIYYANYWVSSKCDKMNGRVAALHFDSATNHGPGRAAKFVQRAIGVADDGVLGPVSIAALNAKDPILVCNQICDQREKFYRAIVANDPSQQVYLNGWLRRIKEMRDFVTDTKRTF